LRLSVRRLVVAVILGEAIWSLLVSVTNNLAIPVLARVMGGDPQSPLYLGKGDINIPALLISILQACLAGIVAVLVNSWPQKGRRTRPAVVRAAANTQRASVPASIAPPSIVAPAVTEIVQGEPSPAEAPPAPKPAAPLSAPSVKEAKPPAKPKKPRQVYYNIVGEPIEDDDE
jgi:large-conductance mechanosensitive channel